MLKKIIPAFVLALTLAVVPSAGAAMFDADFTGATLRLDLFHTGNAETEVVTLDRIRVEGPWPGSRTQLLDRTNLGKYFVEVVDLATQTLLYSRGLCFYLRRMGNHWPGR